MCTKFDVHFVANSTIDEEKLQMSHKISTVNILVPLNINAQSNNLYVFHFKLIPMKYFHIH